MFKSYKLCKPFIFLILSFLVLVTFSRCTVNAFAQEESSQLITKNVYHTHTGSVYGGGCYTRAVTTTRYEKHGDSYCDAGPCGPDTSGQVYYVGTCSVCGEALRRYGSPGRTTCDNLYTINETSYALGCGMTTSTVVGTINVNISPDGWARQKTMSVCYNDSPADATINSQPATDGLFAVTQNGTYTINVKTGPNTSDSSVVVNINDIDNEPPKITDIRYDSSLNIPKTEVQIIAFDSGCGLADYPYSFDNGKTWSADSTMTVSQNCTLNIAVRDRLDNISTQSISINNIDNTPPTITYTFTPAQETYESVVITFSAKDINPDGSDGIGLDENCYSFDKGITYNSDNSITVDKNGDYTVYVRDKNNNIASSVCTISNIKEKPVETPSVETTIVTPQTPFSPAVDSPKEDYPPTTEKTDDKPEVPAISPPLPESEHSIDNEVYPPKTTQSTPVITKPATPAITTAVKKEVYTPPKKINKEIIVEGLPAHGNPVMEKKSYNPTIIILLLLLILLFLGLLLLLFARIALIFNMTTDKHTHFYGINVIRKKNDCYEINISKQMAQSFETNELKIHFPYIFRKLHAKSDVVVYVHNFDSVVTKPAKWFSFTFRE